MPDDLKLGRQLRDLSAADVRLEKRESGATELSFALSSETPVDRWYGTEILSHDKGAIRLDRAKSGAMTLLFNHNRDDALGVVKDARIEDGRLVVDAKFFDTDRAKEVAAMVEGGLRNVSVGYQVHTFEETPKENLFRATDWEPLEASIVTIPADPSVGIGREADSDARPVRVVRMTVSQPEAPASSPKGVTTVTTVETPAAGSQAAESRLSAAEYDKQRREAIIALCKATKLDMRVAQQWCEDGMPLHEANAEALKVMEERGKAKPAAASTLGLSSKETQRYSLFKAIRALAWGAKSPEFIREAAFEIECSQGVAKQLGRGYTPNILIPGEVLTKPLSADAIERGLATRAMATVPGSKGGYMVGVDNMGFIDILRNRSVVMSMGARRLDGLVGNVSFTRQTGKPSVTWQGGDGASVTAADQTLGQLSMTPKTAIAITDVSEQLLRQATPSAEEFVMADLAADIAIDGVDYAAINGTGGAQPIGIKNTTGITSGQDAATVTYAKVLAFVSTAAAANAIRGNPGFVTNAAGAAVLMQKQRFTSTDTPLWDGNILDGSLVGFRAMASEQLASGNLIFGSWDELVVGSWGVLELSMDNGGTRFNQAQVGIRAMWMVDVMLRYPQAFVVSTSLSA